MYYLSCYDNCPVTRMWCPSHVIKRHQSALLTWEEIPAGGTIEDIGKTVVLQQADGRTPALRISSRTLLLSTYILC